jgi:acetyltransferase-like isoleucine patch superfamily enzyme
MKFFIKSLKYVSKQIINLIYWIPPLRIINLTKQTQTPVTLRILIMQKILGFNKNAYWPVHFTSKINGPKFVYCGIETCPGYMPGCYIQGYGGIYIDDYTQIGPNVGLISSNHSVVDNRKGIYKNPIKIGKYCWLGMNSVILPGVELGDFSIIGAGTIVTKSFPEGYVVLGGAPARVIKKINPEECIRFESEIKFNGYIKHESFEKYRKRHLKI